MKRSILFGLAGFGLASMLFALVAFVNPTEQENNGLAYVRVIENINIGSSLIKIAYPDGRVEEIKMEANNIAPAKEKLPNTLKIAQTINKIQLDGFRFISHTSSHGGTYFYETFVFEKK